MQAARTAEIVVALLLFGAGAATIVAAMDFPGSGTLGAPGPARLPIIYGVALCGLAAALLVTTLLAPHAEIQQFGGSLRAVGVMAWTGLFVLLIPQVGFLPASAPWLFIASLLLGGGWRASAIAAVGLPVAIYLGFAMMLGVPLP